MIFVPSPYCKENLYYSELHRLGGFIVPSNFRSKLLFLFSRQYCSILIFLQALQVLGFGNTFTIPYNIVGLFGVSSPNRLSVALRPECDVHPFFLSTCLRHLPQHTQHLKVWVRRDLYISHLSLYYRLRYVLQDGPRTNLVILRLAQKLKGALLFRMSSWVICWMSYALRTTNLFRAPTILWTLLSLILPSSIYSSPS